MCVSVRGSLCACVLYLIVSVHVCLYLQACMWESDLSLYLNRLVGEECACWRHLSPRESRRGGRLWDVCGPHWGEFQVELGVFDFILDPERLWYAVLLLILQRRSAFGYRDLALNAPRLRGACERTNQPAVDLSARCCLAAHLLWLLIH